MGSITKEQLGWACRNRQPVTRSAPLGEITRRLLEGLSTSKAGHLSELQRVIGATTDDLFRRHCTLGPLRHNVLTILVDDESLVCGMRLDWFLPLRESIGERCRGFHVGDIRFEAGRSELTMVGPEICSDQEICEGPQ